MSEDQKHYVYACYVDSELRYIGMGVGTRYKHCTSGKSSCGELNRDFYAGKQLDVKKLHINLTRKEAESIEEKLIRENFDSLYNKVIKAEPWPTTSAISKKKEFKILAKTYSIGEETKTYSKVLSSAGLNNEDVEKLESVLLECGLSLYVVQQGTTKPIIVIDKTSESDVNEHDYAQFCHLAHPSGLWNWKKGLDREMNKF